MSWQSPAAGAIFAWLLLAAFIAGPAIAISITRRARHRRAARPAAPVMVPAHAAALAQAERLAATDDWMRLADVLLCRQCVVVDGLFLACPVHDDQLWQQFEQAAQ